MVISPSRAPAVTQQSPGSRSLPTAMGEFEPQEAAKSLYSSIDMVGRQAQSVSSALKESQAIHHGEESAVGSRLISWMDEAMVAAIPAG